MLLAVMWSQDHAFGRVTENHCMVSILVSEAYGLGLGLLASHSRSWQSVADLSVVHPVLVMNLKFYHHKLIHTACTRYWYMLLY